MILINIVVFYYRKHIKYIKIQKISSCRIFILMESKGRKNRYRSYLMEVWSQLLDRHKSIQPSDIYFLDLIHHLLVYQWVLLQQYNTEGLGPNHYGYRAFSVYRSQLYNLKLYSWPHWLSNLKKHIYLQSRKRCLVYQYNK